MPVHSPPALLDTTLDQLRTLVTVHEVGTALGAARVLGREQSSVQKQLDTLNRNFRELCGEPLVLKQGRGKNVHFTGAGTVVVEMARSTLATWLNGIQECRRRLGGTLSVGTTRFTLGYLVNAAERVSGEFEQRGVDLRIGHLRTADLLAGLRAREMDLVCGSVVTAPDGEADLADLEVMEWRRSGLSVLTNLPVSVLPGPSIATSELPALPLVVPAGGLITTFVRRWFGSGYRSALNIAAEIDTITYGFELLASRLRHGCMLVTAGVGEAAGDGRLPEAQGLRAVELVDDTGPGLEVLVGAFTRRGDRADYPPEHPLNLLWSALAAEHARWQKKQGRQEALGSGAGSV